jgi:Gpi18-like mannosyltransferase
MGEPQAGAARLPSREAPPAISSIDFSLRVPAILVVLVAGLVVRLLLATFPGFGIDVGTFQFWSNQMAADGPWDFYEGDFFIDYAPGYLYILWLIGELHQIFTFSNSQYEYVLKLPSIVADIASIYLLYLFLDNQNMRIRIIAALVYALFPASLFIGAVWGQVDSLLAFFLLLSAYLIAKDRPVWGAVAFVAAFLVKPLAIAVLPFLAFWIMKTYPPRWAPAAVGAPVLAGLILFFAGAGVAIWRYLEGDEGTTLTVALLAVLAGAVLTGGGYLLSRSQSFASQIVPDFKQGHLPVPPDVWYLAFLAPVAVLMVAIFPFFLFKPWEFMDQLQSSANVYPYASFHAYNFWSTFAYLHRDNIEYFGVSYQVWGFVLFAISTLFVIYSLRRSEGRGALALGTALCVALFYMFITRMHERYLFPACLPLLAACFIYNTPLLWAGFSGLAVIHGANLYHAYAEFNDNHLRIDWIFTWLQDPDFWGFGFTTVEFLSLIIVAALPPLLAAAYGLSTRLKHSEAA